MSMRIDSNQGAQPFIENQATGNSTAARASAPEAPGTSSPLGEDQTQLSGAHVQVQALVAHVLQLPEVAQEKVQALRQAVGAGKYQPSPNQVAGALFSSLAVKLVA